MMREGIIFKKKKNDEINIETSIMVHERQRYSIIEQFIFQKNPEKWYETETFCLKNSQELSFTFNQKVTFFPEYTQF